MYKQGKILCDRCSTIITENHNFFRTSPWWEVVQLQRSGGRKRRLDFCNARCRIICLRGRRYYRKKLEYMEQNGVEFEPGSKDWELLHGDRWHIGRMLSPLQKVWRFLAGRK